MVASASHIVDGCDVAAPRRFLVVRSNRWTRARYRARAAGSRPGIVRALDFDIGANVDGQGCLSSQNLSQPKHGELSGLWEPRLAALKAELEKKEPELKLLDHAV